MPKSSKHQDWPLVEAWLADLVANGSKPPTVSAYRTDAFRYLDWVTVESLGLSEVTSADLARFFAWLTAEGAAATTARRIQASLRSLHSFLSASGSGTNPMLELPALPAVVAAPQAHSVDEVCRFLNAAHDRAAARNLDDETAATLARAAALAETIYASGLEASEIVSLPASIASSEAGLVHVAGNGTGRLVILNERAVTAIRLWRTRADALQGRPSAWLFHALRTPNRPLSRTQLDRDIKDISAFARWRVSVSARTLRTSCAVHLLAGGMPPGDVAFLLAFTDVASLKPLVSAALLPGSQ
jgi:integrase/recombinase XerD